MLLYLLARNKISYSDAPQLRHYNEVCP